MEKDTDTEPTIRDVFSAVSACNATLQTLYLYMGGLKEDMAHVRLDIRNINAEDRASAVEDQLSKAIKSAVLDITSLLHKFDNLENRSRQIKIRLVGVPETAEGRDLVNIFESWLATFIGKDSVSPFFAIERAHRVLTRPLPPGAPPRPILLKLLHYCDRDSILRMIHH